jgi:hypothetical protein
MLVCVCICAVSLHRESPPINLEATNPSFLRWFCPIDVVREKEIMGGAIKRISEVKWS